MKVDAPGLEITAAMVDAGLEHFYRYDPDWGECDAEAIVRELYKAMVLARPGHASEALVPSA
jgi:hypothetical protein